MAKKNKNSLIIILVLIALFFIIQQQGREATYNIGRTTLDSCNTLRDARIAEGYTCTECTYDSAQALWRSSCEAACIVDSDCPSTQYCWTDATPTYCRDKIPTGSTQICDRNSQCVSGLCSNDGGALSYKMCIAQEQQPGCTNECSTLGAKRCSSTYTYNVEQCNYFNNELCLSWGPAYTCNSQSHICQAGDCVPKPELCTLGEEKCIDGDRYKCTDPQSGGYESIEFCSDLIYSEDPLSYSNCVPLTTGKTYCGPTHEACSNNQDCYNSIFIGDYPTVYKICYGNQLKTNTLQPSCLLPNTEYSHCAFSMGVKSTICEDGCNGPISLAAWELSGDAYCGAPPTQCIIGEIEPCNGVIEYTEFTKAILNWKRLELSNNDFIKVYKVYKGLVMVK